MKYKFLEHTADIKFIVHGRKLKDIFENVVLAISDFVSNGSEIKSILQKKFKISGRDYEELLYNFIDELIYFIDAENFIPAKAQIKIDKNPNGSSPPKKNKKIIILKAIIFGDNAKNYENLEHIKAATYSEMFIRENKEKNRWEAQAVVDV